MKGLYTLLLILAGVALTIQVSINGRLREAVGNPLTAALVSFIIGTVGMLGVVLATSQPLPNAGELAQIRWYKFLGGLIGAFYVTAVIVTAQKFSAAQLLALIVAGQMGAALVMDYLGLGGFAAAQVTWPRLAGAAMIIIGVYLVNSR